MTALRYACAAMFPLSLILLVACLVLQRLEAPRMVTARAIDLWLLVTVLCAPAAWLLVVTG